MSNAQAISLAEENAHSHDNGHHHEKNKKNIHFKKILSLSIMMFLTFGFFLIELITGLIVKIQAIDKRI